MYDERGQRLSTVPGRPGEWETYGRDEPGWKCPLRYLGELVFALDALRAPYPKEWQGKLGDLEPLVLEVARTGAPHLQQEDLRARFAIGLRSAGPLARLRSVDGRHRSRAVVRSPPDSASPTRAGNVRPCTEWRHSPPAIAHSVSPDPEEGAQMDSRSARVLPSSDRRAGLLGSMGARFMLAGEETGGGFSLGGTSDSATCPCQRRSTGTAA